MAEVYSDGEVCANNAGKAKITAKVGNKKVGFNGCRKKALLYQHECQKIFGTGTKSVRLDNSV